MDHEGDSLACLHFVLSRSYHTALLDHRPNRRETGARDIVAGFPKHKMPPRKPAAKFFH